MKLKQPIIVFGTGRSGTTIFHQMLSRHPHLTWFSPTLHFFPRRHALNKFIMHIMDYSPIEILLRNKIETSECYPFWQALDKGFSAPFRDLQSKDLTNKSKETIINTLEKLPTKKRNRLLIKITGWPRTGYLLEIFNDAKFIHIIRDGRSVANSLINTNFWQGWRGPEKWRWGPLPDVYLNEWLENDQSFVVLAAIQWKLLMDASEKAKRTLSPSQLLEIKYEDLCLDQMKVFNKVADFCDLEWNTYFEKMLRTYHLHNTNSKYIKELTQSQQSALDKVLIDHLSKYGYT